MKTFYNSEASGFIIWGSSDDVKTVEKCKNLLHYVETIFGPAIAKYTSANVFRENYSYNDTIISTTQKQEADDNDVKDELQIKNTTSTVDNDDKHHIEVIEGGTHIKPEIAKELNRTLWNNGNMTVLDALMQTWLLNLEQKGNKAVETENITTAKHISTDNINFDFNVTNTNISMFTTENPIDNKTTLKTTNPNIVTESPISEEILDEISNNSYLGKNIKRSQSKLNLLAISNISESDEEVPINMNTTQSFNSKDNKKGVPKLNRRHVTTIVPSGTTLAFVSKAEILTTTDMSTKSHISKNKKNGWPKFENLDSTDVSQDSIETYEKPSDYQNSYKNKEGLMSSQSKSEILHNFLDLNKEVLNDDSRTIEVSEKNYKSKNIKKGFPKPSQLYSQHTYHYETTTGNIEQDIANDGETAEQYFIKVTTDKVTATTEEYSTVPTEIVTTTPEQLSTGITTEEVTQSDDIEASTKLTNLANNLIVTTDTVEVLDAVKKGAERSIEDSDSLDSEKEQVVVYV